MHFCVGNKGFSKTAIVFIQIAELTRFWLGRTYGETWNLKLLLIVFKYCLLVVRNNLCVTTPIIHDIVSELSAGVVDIMWSRSSVVVTVSGLRFFGEIDKGLLSVICNDSHIKNFYKYLMYVIANLAYNNFWLTNN